MPQKTHVMHGRDHMPGGADPMPWIAGGDTLDQIIANANPDGFWKLNEASGTTAADSSGNAQDMTAGGDLPPLWAQPPGPPGQQTANFENITGSGSSARGGRVSRSWPALSGDFTAGLWVKRNNNLFTPLMGQGTPTRSGAPGWILGVSAFNNVPADTPLISAAGAGSINALNTLAPGVWAFLTVTHAVSSNEWKFYVNGLLQGTLAHSYSAASAPLWIGHDGVSGNGLLPCHCILSYAFLFNRVLSGAELLDMYESTEVLDRTGYVWTLEDGITPSWQPPAGGGGELEEWLSGSGAPAGSLGNVGDWYLNTANGDVHEKTAASTWTWRANIKGPAGATGAAGPAGSTGATGPAGPGVPTGGTTGQVLTKTSAVDYATAWQAAAAGGDIVWEDVGTGSTSAYIPATIADAKGDLIAASAADAVDRLAVGSNGQVLTADSTQALGVRWATPAAGGAELAYAERTSDFTVTGTTLANSTAVITAPSVTLAASTRLMVEFYASAGMIGGSSSAELHCPLYRGSTALGDLCIVVTNSATSSTAAPLYGRSYQTLAAGSYVFEVRAYHIGGTATIFAAAATRLPAFIRVATA